MRVLINGIGNGNGCRVINVVGYTKNIEITLKKETTTIGKDKMSGGVKNVNEINGPNTEAEAETCPKIERKEEEYINACKRMIGITKLLDNETYQKLAIFILVALIEKVDNKIIEIYPRIHQYEDEFTNIYAMIMSGIRFELIEPIVEQIELVRLINIVTFQCSIFITYMVLIDEHYLKNGELKNYSNVGDHFEDFLILLKYFYFDQTETYKGKLVNDLPYPFNEYITKYKIEQNISCNSFALSALGEMGVHYFGKNNYGVFFKLNYR